MQVLAEAKRIAELRITTKVIFNGCICMTLIITGEEEGSYENNDNVLQLSNYVLLLSFSLTLLLVNLKYWRMHVTCFCA